MTELTYTPSVPIKQTVLIDFVDGQTASGFLPKAVWLPFIWLWAFFARSAAPFNPPVPVSRDVPRPLPAAVHPFPIETNPDFSAVPASPG
jgi:hypothetical protein